MRGDGERTEEDRQPHRDQHRVGPAAAAGHAGRTDRSGSGPLRRRPRWPRESRRTPPDARLRPARGSTASPCAGRAPPRRNATSRPGPPPRARRGSAPARPSRRQAPPRVPERRGGAARPGRAEANAASPSSRPPSADELRAAAPAGRWVPAAVGAAALHFAGLGRRRPRRAAPHWSPAPAWSSSAVSAPWRQAPVSSRRRATPRGRGPRVALQRQPRHHGGRERAPPPTPPAPSRARAIHPSSHDPGREAQQQRRRPQRRARAHPRRRDCAKRAREALRAPGWWRRRHPPYPTA